MITVDTNILVRLLVDDPNEEAQVKAARKEVSRARKVFVPIIVQVETVLVLRSGYKLKKAAVIILLEHLAKNQTFHLEADERFRKALAMYRNGKAGFADYLILASAMEQGTEVLTFDKRLGASGNVVLI